MSPSRVSTYAIALPPVSKKNKRQRAHLLKALESIVASQGGYLRLVGQPAVDDPATLDGYQFVDWLRASLQIRRLVINDAKAPIHSVAGTLLLASPGIFKRYAKEHPELLPEALARNREPWQVVQRAFEKLHCHRKIGTLNIWTCQTVGSRQSRLLKGYLLEDPILLLSELPCDNPRLRLLEPTSGGR